MKLEAIVLAAGSGTRYGGGKLLAPWRGGVLLDGALTAAFASPVRGVYVVWGADPGVPKAAVDFAGQSGHGERLRLIHAPEYAMGLSRSLSAGVAALPDDAEGVFIFLGDMPRIPAGLTVQMARALAGEAQVVSPAFGGRRGHPVLFGRSLWAGLASLTGDRGAGELLRDLGDALAMVPAPDDGVLFDVDRPEDLV